MRYVLTGGPCTGKTTTINMLQKYGYNTVKEAASILIEEEFKKTKTHLLERDPLLFHIKLILKQLHFESQIVKNKTTFIDRGIIDTIAYCKIYNVKIMKKFYEIAEKNRYEKIFVLDFLKNYKTNFIRRESQEVAHKIQTTIINTYKEFGYNPILVANQNVEKRMNFILNEISYIKNIQNENFLYIKKSR
jgi:predicted ATPase